MLHIWWNKLLFTKPDLSFGRDDANRYLPWIIGFLAFITTLILAAGLSLNTLIDRTQQSQSRGFTITIPAGDNATASAQKILLTVQNTSGVASAKMMTNADMKSLVSPWLGGAESLEFLPLPVLIEATQTKIGAVDFADLKRALSAISSNAQIDSQSGWMAQYSNAIASLRLLSISMAVLFLGLMGLIVIFVAKTSVRLHHRAVEILHSVGALDRYIASQFQSNVGLLTFKGAFMGTIIGTALYFLMSISASRMDSPLLPRLELSIGHMMLCFLLPAFVVAIAMISTRYSVLWQLSRRP